jgi:hypothetical protein
MHCEGDRVGAYVQRLRLTYAITFATAARVIVHARRHHSELVQRRSSAC